MSRRVLVVYASTHGHTAKVAARVARTLEAAGLQVEVREVEAARGVGVGRYDAAVAGGSVHLGRHQDELVAWARSHAVVLDAMPSAFFSVCLAAAEDTDEARAAARDYIDDFEDDTGWTPARTATFAGALQYREYDFPTRLAMRLLMARGGHPTDITTDVEYTDWDAVDRFARDVAALVPAAAA
jgi:menaquinone-dependent protoporphyrinogen oxidase